jgi:hypothetical protein
MMGGTVYVEPILSKALQAGDAISNFVVQNFCRGTGQGSEAGVLQRRELLHDLRILGVATERGWGEKYAFLILAVLLLLVVPLSLDVFRAVGMPAPAENAAASRLAASFRPMRN